MKTLSIVFATSATLFGVMYAVGKQVDLENRLKEQRKVIDSYRKNAPVTKKAFQEALNALYVYDPQEAHRIHRKFIEQRKFNSIIRNF